MPTSWLNLGQSRLQRKLSSRGPAAWPHPPAHLSDGRSLSGHRPFPPGTHLLSPGSPQRVAGQGQETKRRGDLQHTDPLSRRGHRTANILRNFRCCALTKTEPSLTFIHSTLALLENGGKAAVLGIVTLELSS